MHRMVATSPRAMQVKAKPIPSWTPSLPSGIARSCDGCWPRARRLKRHSIAQDAKAAPLVKHLHFDSVARPQEPAQLVAAAAGEGAGGHDVARAQLHPFGGQGEHVAPIIVRLPEGPAAPLLAVHAGPQLNLRLVG